MNAADLYSEAGTLAYVARCGKCERLWDTQYAPISGGKHGKRDWTPEERYEYVREQAERCCNWTCKMCGKPAWSQFQDLCREHLNEHTQKNEDAREQAAFLKAKPGNFPVFYGDRVFDDMEDLLDHLANHLEGEELPEYVWCAKKLPLTIDASDVIENATQDHASEVAEAIEGEETAALQAALDAWCATIPAWSYVEDRTRYVAVKGTES